MFYRQSVKWICLLCLSVLVCACSKEDTSKQYGVEPFSKINTGENVNVTITQQAEQNITTNGSGLEHLQVSVVNDELFLAAPGFEGGLLNVSVAVPAISAIVYRVNSIVSLPTGFTSTQIFKIDGRNNAQLQVGAAFEVPQLSIDIRDESLMGVGELLTEKLYLIGRQNTTCYISGTARRAQINLYNQAQYHLGDAVMSLANTVPLLADEHFVELRGEAKAWVYAANTLRVEGYNNCQVFVKGRPQLLIQNLYQSATLTQKEQ